MIQLLYPSVNFSRSFITFLCCAFFACGSLVAKPTILVMGDSLSAAYQMAPHNGWVALLENKLKNEFRESTVINSSIVGDTSGNGLQRLPAQLSKYHPDIVIITLGGNDGLRGLPITAIKANLKKMITLCQAQQAKVILIGMRLPPNYGKSYTEQFANNYLELSKEMNVPLLPFFLENVALAPGLMFEDKIHPTAKAQPVLLNNLWPILEPLLTEYR